MRGHGLIAAESGDDFKFISRLNAEGDRSPQDVSRGVEGGGGCWFVGVEAGKALDGVERKISTVADCEFDGFAVFSFGFGVFF